MSGILSPPTVEKGIIVKTVKQQYPYPWQEISLLENMEEEFAEDICLPTARAETVEVSLLEGYTKEEADNQMATQRISSRGTLI